MTDRKNWAEKEVELACKHAAKTGRKEGEFDYNRACYKSALKAYNSLMEDGHSRASIQFTKDIQNNLADIFVDSIQNLQKNLSECDIISNSAGTIRLLKNKK